jgi:hypothetical protein
MPNGRFSEDENRHADLRLALSKDDLADLRYARNLLFIDHFQDVARGHFIVRRLERAYGAETVRAADLGLSPE